MIDFLKLNTSSRIQECLAEYAFLKDLLTDGIRNQKKVLISRSDFDEFGYDVLAQVENEERITKLQLKAFNGKTRRWDVHKSLVMDPKGNIVVIKVYEKDSDLMFDYHILRDSERHIVLNRPVKNKKHNKCQLNWGDLELVSPSEIFSKILTPLV